MTGIRWSREFIPFKRGTVQIMVGRPRKRGRREPNGRVARAYVNPKAQVAAQPHRLAVSQEHREWPEAESEFGRLMLRGVITPAQHEAGRRYAGLASSYRAVLGIPPLHPRSPDLLSPGPALRGDFSTETARGIKDRYDKAFEVLGDAGRKALRAVRDHAVFERKVDSFETLDHLRRGLEKLVDHFGLDRNLEISSRHKCR